MAITRSMTAKLNQDASSSRKRPKTTVDNLDGDSASWSYLIHDILVSVISRLGVIDFVAFSCVCKSWRTVALSNRSMFMLCRGPMYLRFSSKVAKKEVCYLEDLEGRKFKTILPVDPSDSICLGLVSGYLILYGRKTHDFRLVNPITRHDLHFPRYKFHKVPEPKSFRCTLVFLPTMSTWVFVFLTRFSNKVSFSFSSEGAKWTHVVSDSEFYIIDLIFFQGKIYTLSVVVNLGLRLCELRLSPTSSFTKLEMKNLMFFEVMCPEFATWGEKLYVVGQLGFANDTYLPFEVDFDQMRLVKSAQALKEYACFVTKMSAITKLEVWKDPCEQYERFGFFHGTAKNDNKGIRYTEDMWYFPHKCLDVNLYMSE